MGDKENGGWVFVKAKVTFVSVFLFLLSLSLSEILQIRGGSDKYIEKSSTNDLPTAFLNISPFAEVKHSSVASVH